MVGKNFLRKLVSTLMLASLLAGLAPQSAVAQVVTNKDPKNVRATLGTQNGAPAVYILWDSPTDTTSLSQFEIGLLECADTPCNSANITPYSSTGPGFRSADLLNPAITAGKVYRGAVRAKYSAPDFASNWILSSITFTAPGGTPATTTASTPSNPTSSFPYADKATHRFTWEGGTAPYVAEVFRETTKITTINPQYSTNFDQKVDPNTNYEVRVFNKSDFDAGNFSKYGVLKFKTDAVLTAAPAPTTATTAPTKPTYMFPYADEGTYRFMWEGGTDPFVAEVFRENVKITTINPQYSRNFDQKVDPNTNYEVRVFNKSDFDAGDYSKSGILKFKTNAAAGTTPTATIQSTSANGLEVRKVVDYIHRYEYFNINGARYERLGEVNTSAYIGNDINSTSFPCSIENGQVAIGRVNELTANNATAAGFGFAVTGPKVSNTVLATIAPGTGESSFSNFLGAPSLITLVDGKAKITLPGTEPYYQVTVAPVYSADPNGKSNFSGAFFAPTRAISCVVKTNGTTSTVGTPTKPLNIGWSALSGNKLSVLVMQEASSTATCAVNLYSNGTETRKECAAGSNNVVFDNMLTGQKYFIAAQTKLGDKYSGFLSSKEFTYGDVAPAATSGGATTAPKIQSLNQPANLTVNAATGDATWGAVPNAQRYTVELNRGECTSVTSCNWNKIGAESTGQTSIKFNGLTANTQYQISVTAYVEQPIDAANPTGPKETVKSTPTISTFTTSKATENWTEGSQGTIGQVDGVAISIENGNVVLKYDMPIQPDEEYKYATADKLVLKLNLSNGSSYDLKDKIFSTTNRMQGRVEIPVGNLQGMDQMAALLRSGGPQNVSFSFVPFLGSSTIGMVRTSNSILIPEPGNVSFTGSFTTQAGGAGSSTPIEISAVSGLSAVYNTDTFAIDLSWTAVSNASQYAVTVTSDGFNQSFNVSTASTKVFFPKAGSTYTVKVAAVASDGNKSPEQSTTVTVPAWKPYPDQTDVLNQTSTTTINQQSTTVTTTNGQTIPGNKLTWTAITDTLFTNYRVYVRKKETNPVNWQYAANYDAGKLTEYQVVGLSPSTKYEYRVAAQYYTLRSGENHTILDTIPEDKGYVMEVQSGNHQMIYKYISDPKEFDTPATQTQPESLNLAEAYKRALANSRYLYSCLDANCISTGMRQMQLHLVYKDANGNSQILQNVLDASVAGALTLRSTPGFSQQKEWYAKVTPTNVPGTVEGVMITTKTWGPVESGDKAVVWALDRSSKTDLGTCPANYSPYCEIPSLTDRTRNIYVPVDKLSNGLLLETLSLPSGGLRSHYVNGVQVVDVEYDNKFMGYPISLEFNIPTINSSDFPQATLLGIEGGDGNLALFGNTTTVKNVKLVAQFTANTTKCEVQENGGNWEEVQCVKDNVARNIPYTLKTSTAGDVNIVLRATNSLGVRTSQQKTIKYMTTTPTVTLTGVPTTWSSAAVKGIEARCGTTDGACKQIALVATNLLSANQECSDLPTVAPTLLYPTVCSQENNFCRNESFTSQGGANPTYMCAVTRNEAGVLGFAPKQQLRTDLVSPQVSFSLTGLTQAGASYFTKNSAVTLKMDDIVTGSSGMTSCTIGGDITGTVACPAKGQTTTLNLTAGNAPKRVTVTIKNGANVENLVATYVIKDEAAPVFTEASNIVAYDKNANGTVKIKPAMVDDENLDRIELTFSGGTLPSDLLSVPFPGTNIDGQKIVISANEQGQMPSSLLTTGLSLQGLSSSATYTVSQKAFDKAGNETAGTKTLQFTLTEAVSTQEITVTGGTATFPATSDSTQIPLNLTFSSSPVYYTLTRNGAESVKVLYNGFIYLDPGDHSNLTLKFYDSQNRQIGQAYSNLSTKVTLVGATATIDKAEIIRTKADNFSFALLGINSNADKVSYKILRGGTQLLSGDRLKADYNNRLDIDNLVLTPNSTNEFFITLKEDGENGKETVVKRTVIHDTEAPQATDIQSSIVETDKPKWSFKVADAAATGISSVQARLTNLTIGEARSISTLNAAANGQYEVAFNDLPMRPGHEYVLDIITEDALGNKAETRTPVPLVRQKAQKDIIDMLQKAVNVDNTIVSTEQMQVTLTNAALNYAAQMPRGKQVIFGDILSKGKNTMNNQTLTRLPVGSYLLKILTVGGTEAKTQTLNNFIVEPYFADANADLNGDGVVGVSDEVLFNYGKETNKYPSSNSDISTLTAAIAAKLAQAKQANITEYLKR